MTCLIVLSVNSIVLIHLMELDLEEWPPSKGGTHPDVTCAQLLHRRIETSLDVAYSGAEYFLGRRSTVQYI